MAITGFEIPIHDIGTKLSGVLMTYVASEYASRPAKSDPLSPKKTFAGATLNTRNPPMAPARVSAIIAMGVCPVFRNQKANADMAMTV